ncbi:M15 family metallopeptidase [Microbacterium sp. W4I20]|uniref:M15 family metallopeptidase n=1 Tax=Microbacterium sp. W4I20 TaxID=3042262 RepID=UPI00277E1186|nr:M15 family metallopeptidase [Microbacterium sp. W4I20]MDQ0727152.1 D-alanyl-D-alanine carboxypeptidase [Microbacterium sp. W4I20]
MNTSTIPVSRPARRRRRLIVTAVALAAAVILAFAVQQSLAAASAAVPKPTATSSAPADTPAQQVNGSPIAPSDADGVIREGDQPTVFDTDRVAVGKLDPALLDALQRAANDAAADGLEFRVNSGWRSAALQEHMLREAVVQYGSEAEAARWVASPTTSAHVSGQAVDLGPLPTLDWLAQRGSDYGLCQIYANESWHYELRPDAVNEGCPEMYSDPTEDPRMQP